MNLRHLSVFKAVMNGGSTIAAGTLLQMSQSAISRQLAAFEAELGFALFQRDKGRLIPTREARALIADVEELVERFGRMERRADDLRIGVGGETYLKIAFPHSMTTTILPPVIRTFLETDPKFAIEVLSGPYDMIELLVTDRAADIGFVRLPTELRGFGVVPLVESDTVCALPKGHPLSKKPALTLADIASADLVLLGRQRVNRQELEEQLRAIRPTIRCRVETHAVETCCAMVAAGLGVAVVPELIARFFRSMPIVLKPVRPAMSNQYGIISPPGQSVSRPASVFIEVLRKGISRAG